MTLWTATAGAFNGGPAMMVTGSIEIAVKNQAPYLHPGTWYWHVGFPTTSDPTRAAQD